MTQQSNIFYNLDRSVLVKYAFNFIYMSNRNIYIACREGDHHKKYIDVGLKSQLNLSGRAHLYPLYYDAYSEKATYLSHHSRINDC